MSLGSIWEDKISVLKMWSSDCHSLRFIRGVSASGLLQGRASILPTLEGSRSGPDLLKKGEQGFSLPSFRAVQKPDPWLVQPGMLAIPF